MIRFLRDYNIRHQLHKSWKERGLVDASTLILAARVPSFIAWRWGKLRKSFDVLSRFIETFFHTWDVQAFKQDHDPERVKTVNAIVNNPMWMVWYSIVEYITVWITDIQSWGGGCACHEKEIMSSDGRNVTCWKKGRRLPEAYDYVVKALARGRDAINEWTVGRTGGDQSLLDSVQATARSIYYIGLRLTSYLDCLPYLFARLRTGNVRDRILFQWHSCDPCEHHRVTRAILACPFLYSDVVATKDDGSGTTPRLDRALAAIEDLSAADVLGEGGHAQAGHVHDDAPGASWPWIAATVRMPQNITGVT